MTGNTGILRAGGIMMGFVIFTDIVLENLK